MKTNKETIEKTEVLLQNELSNLRYNLPKSVNYRLKELNRNVRIININNFNISESKKYKYKMNIEMVLTENRLFTINLNYKKTPMYKIVKEEIIDKLISFDPRGKIKELTILEFISYTEDTIENVKEYILKIKDLMEFNCDELDFDLKTNENGELSPQKVDIWFSSGEEFNFELNEFGSIWEINDDNGNDDYKYYDNYISMLTNDELKKQFKSIIKSKIKEFKESIDELIK